MIAVAAVVLAFAAISFVLFIREKDVPEPIPVSPVEHLEDRKRAVYDNLRDLQFEYRLGKLSDEDYQQTKQALQRELAIVLSEIETVLKNLGLTPARVSSKSAAIKRPSTLCPHCGAQFPQPLKFCGECGKAMA
ncbi:MAG: zinc ribbon domain-containing protein [Acidobacteriota bacterium]|nr:zinc ribbon domain-containing protein [Acidobacteriota bacterium]